MRPRPHVIPRLILVVPLVILPLGGVRAQQPHKLSSIDMGRDQQILKDAYNEVKKNYYDPNYHGVDWDAKYREAEEQLPHIASNSQAFSVVASLMMSLEDSHAFFVAPRRASFVEYGFRIQMIGDRAYIAQVRPETDAVEKVQIGDEVIAWNRYIVDRRSLWKLNYYFNSLSPLGGSALVLRHPDGRQQEVYVKATVIQLKREMDLTLSKEDTDIFQLMRMNEAQSRLTHSRWYENGDVLIWKLPEFTVNESSIDHGFGLARKHKTLVLDLRDNQGGAVSTLEDMLGHVFDHEVKIADRVGRKELKPQIAKPRRDRFDGKLIVLIDSSSASAAELFARVIQLEHRGTELGDRSAGAVMEARFYGDMQGADVQIYYGFSVTDANLIMTDGKSLERVGVVPDVAVLPTALDLAQGKDPALARALQLAGVTMDLADAAKLFPYQWLPLWKGNL